VVTVPPLIGRARVTWQAYHTEPTVCYILGMTKSKKIRGEYPGYGGVKPRNLQPAKFDWRRPATKTSVNGPTGVLKQPTPPASAGVFETGQQPKPGPPRAAKRNLRIAFAADS